MFPKRNSLDLIGIFFLGYVHYLNFSLLTREGLQRTKIKSYVLKLGKSKRQRKSVFYSLSCNCFQIFNILLILVKYLTIFNARNSKILDC